MYSQALHHAPRALLDSTLALLTFTIVLANLFRSEITWFLAA